MAKEKIVLAYSGGLDTSVAIAWLMNKGYDVIACCIDVGEGLDLDAIQQKAAAIGAWKSVVIDAKRDFAEQFVLPALQVHAMYEQKYPLVSALSRPLIVQKLVGVAKEYGATAIAHGCTGKGNDQVRFEAGIHALAPEMKIEDPIRDWHWSREEEIQYAKDNNIPVPITKASPYSIDQNLWGRANECGILEDPWVAAPEDAYERTTPIEETPDQPTVMEITFKEGVPTALDGEELPLDQLIMKLDKVAGEHGIGRIDHVENRLVGIKSREIYECPAATVLLAAHKDMEDLTQEREVAHFKPTVELKMNELIYNGLWYSPLMNLTRKPLPALSNFGSCLTRFMPRSRKRPRQRRERRPMPIKKMWGGRFEEAGDQLVDQFGASISFDQEMAKEDIMGSLAHVKMLKATQILTPQDADQIIAGLQELAAELADHGLPFDVENEDIHMNIEALLTAKIGPVAGKLHTGRSRNDQVATDFHLYVKERLPQVIGALKDLQAALVKQAEQNVETVMPGYTHMQHAQPISYGHYLMAYFQMFQRDVERFQFNQQHTDLSPLGAAALAGTTFPIDREMTAHLLGFSAPYANSLDAVSDRDFALEFLSNASILMVHLSRLCEELIYWCSYEFGYLELADAYSTGSSIMPQKKNPDMAELIRGKSGRVFGSLTGLLTVMKGLPLAYNKDMQEDKEGVFDAVKTILPSLKVMTGMIATLQVNKEKMAQATHHDFSNATELADYLATKGIPFRRAHEIVGELVLKGLKTGTDLADIPLAEFQQIDSGA